MRAQITMRENANHIFYCLIKVFINFNISEVLHIETMRHSINRAVGQRQFQIHSMIFRSCLFDFSRTHLPNYVP